MDAADLNAYDTTRFFAESALEPATFWRRFDNLVLEHTGERSRVATLGTPTGAATGAASAAAGEGELDCPALGFKLVGPTPEVLLERFERVLIHRAEHGPPDQVILDQTDGPDAVARMVAAGTANLDGAGVTLEEVDSATGGPATDPDEEVEASRAAIAAAEAEDRDPNLLDATEYTSARAIVLNIGKACTVAPLEAIDRLVATAEHSLKVRAEHVLRNGLTDAQARESIEATELELAVFRAFRSFRKRVGDVVEQAQAKAPQGSVIGANAVPGPKAPPPPPNRTGRRKRR